MDWLQTIRTNKESSRNEALTWNICNQQQWMQQSINEAENKDESRMQVTEEEPPDVQSREWI